MNNPPNQQLTMQLVILIAVAADNMMNFNKQTKQSAAEVYDMNIEYIMR